MGDDNIIQRGILLYHNRSQNSFQNSIQMTWINNNNSSYLEHWLHCANGMNISCVTIWAEESFEDALNYAYKNEFGDEIIDGVTLSEEYFKTRLMIVEKKIAA